MSRLGSYVPQSINELHPSRSRTVVNKVVPFYASSVYFDLVGTAWSIVVSGSLIGSSNSDLANQMAYFQAVVREMGVIWIDVSDQYPYQCMLCKVTAVDGPTLSSKTSGPLVATWSLTAVVLLPWGTSMSNPWSRTSDIIFRDLNGIGKDVIINPLEKNCNFQLVQDSQFSWELIVDNQNMYSPGGPSGIITECDATTGFTAPVGSGASITANAKMKRQGTAALELTATSNSSGVSELQYTTGTAKNLSTVDYICFWFRSDFGGNSTGQFNLLLLTSGTSYYEWLYPGLNANQWYRLVVPLRAPTSTSGSPSLSSILDFQFATIGKASSSTNMWIDDVVIDIGMWVYIEAMIPDDIAQSQLLSPIQIQSWNGSAYVQAMSIDPLGYYYSQPSAPYALNGALLSSYYSSNNQNIYIPNTIGLTGAPTLAPNGEESSITYTTTWGTNNRFAYAIKLAPATSDSISGNMPSNDISGIQAINKARLKFVICNSDENTTYSGM